MLVLPNKTSKRFYFLLVLVILFKCGIAQNNTYFNKTFSHFDGYFNYNEGGVILADTNYFIVSYAKTNNNSNGIGSLIITPSGILVDSLVIEEANFSFQTGAGREISKISNSTLLYCGGKRDNSINYDFDSHIAKFNNKGDTIWTKVVKDPLFSELPHAIVFDGGKYLYMVGGSNQFSPDSFPLTKIDTNGIQIWKKGLPGYQSFSIELGKEDGILYVGATYEVMPNSYDMNGRVIKCDTLGNILWERNIGGGGLERSRNLISSIDSGVFAIGDTALYDNDDIKKPYVIRFDKNGKRIWSRVYLESESPVNWFRNGLIDSDTSLILCGNAVLPYGTGSRVTGIVSKLKSENGSVAWQRTYYTCDTVPFGNAEHRFSDIIKANDGGYLLVGWSINEVCNGQETWVVKTNCLGFDEPPFANFYVNNLSHTYLSATFKNVSTHCDEVIWNFGDGSPEIKVKTTDVDWTPTHVFPDEGSYTIKMTAFACGDTMEFERTIVLDKALGNEELRIKNGELEIYPNPFTDKLNLIGMEIGNELEVRDVVGRVIYKGRIESRQVELNTTEWNNGTYFVISTNGEQRSRGVYVKQ